MLEIVNHAQVVPAFRIGRNIQAHGQGVGGENTGIRAQLGWPIGLADQVQGVIQGHSLRPGQGQRAQRPPASLAECSHIAG